MRPESILQTTNKAAARANKVIQMIKDSVDDDLKARKDGKDIGFHHNLIHSSQDEPTKGNKLEAFLDQWAVAGKSKKGKKNWKKDEKRQEIAVDSPRLEECQVRDMGRGSAVLMPQDKGVDAWGASSDEEMEGEVTEVAQKAPNTKMDEDSGSEEEAVVVLNADKVTNKSKRFKK